MIYHVDCYNAVNLHELFALLISFGIPKAIRLNLNVLSFLLSAPIHRYLCGLCLFLLHILNLNLDLNEINNYFDHLIEFKLKQNNMTYSITFMVVFILDKRILTAL